MHFPKTAVLLSALVVCLSLPMISVAQTATESLGVQQSSPQSQLGTAAGQAAKSAATATQAQQPTTTAPQSGQIPATVSEPTPSQAETSAPLRVLVDKSLLITTTDRLKRVSVTDPAIADAIVVTPTQVLIHGRSPGEVSLILWDEQERSRSFDLRVDADVTAAAQEIHRILPEDKIDVEASRSAIVLSGHVATKEDADRAGMIAGAFSKNVVNALTYGPVGAQEVLLEVKFAEVNRAALTQLGVNILSTGAANTIGTIGTQQFNPFTSVDLTDTTGKRIAPFTTSTTIQDVLNMFVFRPDIHLGVIIKALQQKNLLQILAEPNLIAVNGKESSFLAGGEFPFPIVQPSGSGLNTVTIQFKEFGVRLKFTPLIMPNGNIHLRVNPEVSALDFANALTISGFTIPALSTRRADTELEIQDGQSFVIAGLMDNRVTNVANKIPGLGDIPVLGYLFRSKSFQKSNTELMVLVTARRISPSPAAPPLPKYPEKFMPPLSQSAPSGK